jgi:hypothetical protein
LLSCVLVALLVLLLYGIARQLPGPGRDTSPGKMHMVLTAELAHTSQGRPCHLPFWRSPQAHLSRPQRAAAELLALFLRHALKRQPATPLAAKRAAGGCGQALRLEQRLRSPGCMAYPGKTAGNAVVMDTGPPPPTFSTDF